MSLSIVADGTLSTLSDVAFANKYRLRRMWLISPWITLTEDKADPLYRLIEAHHARHGIMRLLTRPPKERWHIEAVRLLRDKANCEIMFSSQLHAKLYILECDGFRYAMVGSPNLTRRADVKNRELAIELRTTYSAETDEVSAMMNELLVYAYDLMSEEEALLQT